jgi:polysaccharide pyruvyl transferase WcaK-like protein
VIVPGGALFQQYFAKCMKTLINECMKYNIPVSFNACGYGKNDKKSTMLFQWILKQPCIRQVTTRDDLSSLTQEYVKMIPDVAIMAYHYYNFKDYNNERRIIGMNIISPALYLNNSNDMITYDEFNQKTISIIEQLSKSYKITLFSNGDIYDQEYVYWLSHKLQDINITFEKRPTNGFELIKIIYKFSLVIGYRLHSLITAYSFDIPTIGIAWDKKLNYWGKMIENRNIYLLSEFPVRNIGKLSKELINQGIDKNKKKELENQIIEQIRTYV